jgi:hypothetical protein
MASSVSTKTGESQQKSLLQTDNIFLYVPNIIGEQEKNLGNQFNSLF